MRGPSGVGLAPEGSFWQQVRTQSPLWRRFGVTRLVPATGWGKSAHENDTGFSPGAFSQEAGSNRSFWCALLLAGAPLESPLRRRSGAGGRVPAAPPHKDAAPAPNSRRSGTSCREGRRLLARGPRATPRSAPAENHLRRACARFFSAGCPCADRSATGQCRCSRPDRNGRSSCPRGSGRCGT